MPYGISQIVAPPRPSDGAHQRYFVRGGTKASPFEIQVDWPTLNSALRFRRALGEHLGRPVPGVVPEVWAGTLERAFADPGFVRWADVGERASKPSVEDLVAEFAATATPWKEPSPGAPPARPVWPVVRGGQVLAPLRAFVSAVARRLDGPSPALGDVTRAVRALGGGPYGSPRFGNVKVRVWGLPYRPSAVPPPARGTHA
jgi:hypothetical protein